MSRRRTKRCPSKGARRLDRKVDHSRGGFTLVEMLISVTLVLLMMTMFTSIFQMATETVSTQRGIAQNNQKARAFVSVLRADFAKRTMRYAQPFQPLESPSVSPTPFGTRSGYLYISTNDKNSGLDDLLQFTVNVTLTQEDPDQTQYFGAAKLLYDLQADNGEARSGLLVHNLNQPDADDNQALANEVGASVAAEISYFVRNGSLYRRVMLLRDPIRDDASNTPTSGRVWDENSRQAISNPFIGETVNGGVFAYIGVPQAISFSNTKIAAGDSPPSSWGVTATNDFWAHFDYSAVPSTATNTPTTAAFVGIDALDNSLDNTSGLTTVLGDPKSRFGFNPLTGWSREHDHVGIYPGTQPLFIGRFTQAETSHPDFNWPLAASRSGESTLNTGSLLVNSRGDTSNGNPMDIAGTPLVLNQSTGIVGAFSDTSSVIGRGGPRRVEDLLLANVHGFKVEIWDERLGRFVQPNHQSLAPILTGGGIQQTAGDFHFSRRLNVLHGPHGNLAPVSRDTNAVFDTWHKDSWYNYNGDGVRDNNEMSPPFIAYRYYPPRESDPTVSAGGTYTRPSGPGPSPNLMPNPYSEYDPETGLNQKNKGYWVGSDFASNAIHEYEFGDVVFAQFRDIDGDGFFNWAADESGIPASAFQIGYRCIRPGYSGDPADYGLNAQPAWPRVPGQRTTEMPIAGYTGTLQPAIWESFDNRRPLQSIRVTVDFFDQNTEKLRQLSFIVPVTTDR